jgi:hypothetical protein
MATGDFGPIEADAYLLIIAVRHLLALSDRYAERFDAAQVREARRRLDREAPDAKALRDVLAHIDEYALGRGQRKTSKRMDSGSSRLASTQIATSSMSAPDGCESSCAGPPERRFTLPRRLPRLRPPAAAAPTTGSSAPPAVLAPSQASHRDHSRRQQEASPATGPLLPWTKIESAARRSLRRRRGSVAAGDRVRTFRHVARCGSADAEVRTAKAHPRRLALLQAHPPRRFGRCWRRTSLLMPSSRHSKGGGRRCGDGAVPIYRRVGQTCRGSCSRESIQSR